MFPGPSTVKRARGCRSGCFVRLCGRSPKDGEPLNRQSVWDDYTRTLQQLTGHTHGDAAAFDESTVDANTRLRAITHASARSFRCRSGNDVMNLLLTSERVHRCKCRRSLAPCAQHSALACSDMIDWLNFGEPEQVVLRQWTDGFEIENEFRLFVCEGQLTAASQYDHYAYYPALHEAHASLQLELQQVALAFNLALAATLHYTDSLPRAAVVAVRTQLRERRARQLRHGRCLVPQQQLHLEQQQVRAD